MEAAIIILCVAVLVLGIVGGKPWGWLAGALALLALLMLVLHWNPFHASRSTEEGSKHFASDGGEALDHGMYAALANHRALAQRSSGHLHIEARGAGAAFFGAFDVVGALGCLGFVVQTAEAEGDRFASHGADPLSS